MTHRPNCCDGCKRPLVHGEQVVALIPSVEVVVNKLDNKDIRLKLSNDAIDARTLKIYCQECLNLKHFQVSDGV